MRDLVFSRIMEKWLRKLERNPQIQESSILEQWFSTFLILPLLNTVPEVVVTLNHKIMFVVTS